MLTLPSPDLLISSLPPSLPPYFLPHSPSSYLQGVLNRHAFLQALKPLGVDVGLLLVLRLVAGGCAGKGAGGAGAAGWTRRREGGRGGGEDECMIREGPQRSRRLVVRPIIM